MKFEWKLFFGVVRPGQPFGGLLALIGRAMRLVLLAACLMGILPAVKAAEFLDPDVAFPVSVREEGGRWWLQFDVVKGYYLYRDKIAVKPLPGESIAGLSAAVPAGVKKFDENLGKEVETLRGQVRIALTWSGPVPDALEVHSQGCADAGLCYPPQVQQVRLTGGLPSPAPGVADEAGALAQSLQSGRVFGVLLTFFGLGLLLAFTPCVLPMVPILSAVIVGQQGGQSPQNPQGGQMEPAGLGRNGPDRGRAFRLALAYVAGMSVVYTAVGVAAGLTGQGLVAALQTPWVLSVFAAFLFALGVAMLGAYELQLPLGLQNWVNAKSAGLQGGRYGSVVLMGGLSAVLVGPCVAPPLAGALLYLSTTGDWLLGGAALMALSWGLGTPLLVAAGAAGQVLPKAGAWMESVKRFFGFLLMALAIYTLAPIVSTPVLMGAWAVFLLVAAAWAGALQVLPAQAGALARCRQGLAWVMLVVGLMQAVGAGLGADDVFRPLAPLQASRAGANSVGTGQVGSQTSGSHEGLPFVRIPADSLDATLAGLKQPAFLDFYADWCVACKEMERFTFSDSRVQQALSGVVWLQVDVTRNTAADQALLKRFKLFGPPGIVFFDAAGREIPGARVVGFQDAPRFLQTLNAVYGSNPK